MAFSTLVKNAINWVLAPANLRLDTLTSQRAEEARIGSLHANGYFRGPSFPTPKTFELASVSAILAALPQFKARFDTFCDPSKNEVGYTFENDYFHSPDAEVLYTLIRTKEPKRIIEIGSGHSTKVARQAIFDGKLDCRLISIDPQPRAEINSLANECLRRRVEDVEPALFDTLQSGDVLFIDSSHEMRIGNDCVLLYSNVVPRLARDVLIHIHDISLPYEYPLETLSDAADWNEQYVVQAMLTFGDAFEVIWPGTSYSAHATTSKNPSRITAVSMHRVSGCENWRRAPAEMVIDKLLSPFLRLPHFKGKTRIETMLCRLLWTPNQTEVFGDLRMELDPAEWTQMQLLKRNWIEPRTLALYRELLRPGDVFVDVGAHVGFHSLVARQFVGPAGLVVAIEPQPYNAQKILANWRANNFSNLKMIIAAAGARDGWVELSHEPITDRSLLSLYRPGGKDQAQHFEVPIVMLDSVLERYKISKVKLLKLDVEGYETEVIGGLRKNLHAIENIIVEILPAAATSAEVTNMLQDHGFELRTVEDRQWQTGEALLENNLWAHLAA